MNAVGDDVGVHEDHHVALRNVPAAVAGTARVALVVGLDDPRPGGPGDRRGVVGRAVLEDDDVVRHTDLSEQAFDRGHEARSLVVRGYEDDDFGRARLMSARAERTRGHEDSSTELW